MVFQNVPVAASPKKCPRENSPNSLVESLASFLGIGAVLALFTFKSRRQVCQKNPKNAALFVWKKCFSERMTVASHATFDVAIIKNFY